MNRIVVLMLLICGSFILVKSQTPSPASLPNNRPQPVQPQRNDRRDRTLAASFIFSNPIAYVAPLYRKPNKKELQIVSPSETDLQKYADFLEQPKTGIFRLVPDQGCPQDTRIVDASEDCLKYKLPGSGSAFSFRRKSYQYWRLSDLIYSGGKFLSVGLFQQGIISELGDVELEKVSIETAGLKFINNYVPLVKLNEVKNDWLKFKKGVTADNFKYSNNVQATVNSTYVFRTVAYRGNYYRSLRGITYNEFDFDERKDVTVAFRVIKREEDGSLIILWKELSRKDSPKFRIDKKELMKEAKPQNFVAKN
jgi:hypothetical protein